MDDLQEANGIKVGSRVRFLGWEDPDEFRDVYLGIFVGDVGTVTRIVPSVLLKHPSFDVDFPGRDRQLIKEDPILYPGEFELVEEPES